MNNLKRNENESLLGYYKRLVDNRKEYDLDYSELGEIILGESKYSSDNVRKAVYLLKRDTRRFAKRQLTWFRRERDVIWVDKSAFDYDDEKILKYMLEEIEKRGLK